MLSSNCDGRHQTRAPVDSSLSQLLGFVGLPKQTTLLRVLSSITSLWLQQHLERVHTSTETLHKAAVYPLHQLLLQSVPSSLVHLLSLAVWRRVRGHPDQCKKGNHNTSCSYISFADTLPYVTKCWPSENFMKHQQNKKICNILTFNLHN